jgi:hypothetical protein
VEATALRLLIDRRIVLAPPFDRFGARSRQKNRLVHQVRMGRSLEVLTILQSRFDLLTDGDLIDNLSGSIKFMHARGCGNAMGPAVIL